MAFTFFVCPPVCFFFIIITALLVKTVINSELDIWQCVNLHESITELQVVYKLQVGQNLWQKSGTYRHQTNTPQYMHYSEQRLSKYEIFLGFKSSSIIAVAGKQLACNPQRNVQLEPLSQMTVFQSQTQLLDIITTVV